MKDGDYDPMEVVDIQHYNPLYSVFFQMNDDNYNRIELNQNYRVLDKKHVVSRDSKKKECDVFIKYAPLLDPVHFLIGKYEKEHSKIRLPSLSNQSECISKISLTNNASYVDNFFNYLSSQMLHHHHVIHGIDYFGSNVAIQKKFRLNLYDDMDYLEDSEFFLKNHGILYELDEANKTDIMRALHNTQSKRPKLHFDESACEMTSDDFDDVLSSNHDEEREAPENDAMEVVYEKEAVDIDAVDHDSDSDSDDSEICNSSDDDEGDEGKDRENEADSDSDDADSDDEDADDADSDDEDADDADSDDEDDDELFAYLYNFPVQMIALEKCDGTLDSLLEEEELDSSGIISALMQVIFTLIIYQRAFSFTHNDLHTNNILFKRTKEKFIYYKYKKQTYKVPTYGRIYKIIDFGRAIYRFQDKWLCSDSFAPGGDAHGQYNFGEYMDTKKALLEPNPSFDLCRLGCSMLDFMFEDDPPAYEKMNPAQKVVWDWCHDDFGKNILYRKNGEERYPNFKLYKMISRLVHQHSPDAQLEKKVFQQYLTELKPTRNYVDIDKIPKYYA